MTFTIEQADRMIGPDGTAPLPVDGGGYRTTANSQQAVDRICERATRHRITCRVYGLFVILVSSPDD